MAQVVSDDRKLLQGHLVECLSGSRSPLNEPLDLGGDLGHSKRFMEGNTSQFKRANCTAIAPEDCDQSEEGMALEGTFNTLVSQTSCRFPNSLEAQLMNRSRHSGEFREQAPGKLRQRGARSVREIAEELDMSACMLRKWWSGSNRSTVEPTLAAELPTLFQPSPERCSTSAWVAAVARSVGATLSAWCREKGRFENQLIAWREAFCAIAAPEMSDAKLALRELEIRRDGLPSRKERFGSSKPMVRMMQRWPLGQASRNDRGVAMVSQRASLVSIGRLFFIVGRSGEPVRIIPRRPISPRI